MLCSQVTMLALFNLDFSNRSSYLLRLQSSVQQTLFWEVLVFSRFLGKNIVIRVQELEPKIWFPDKCLLTLEDTGPFIYLFGGLLEENPLFFTAHSLESCSLALMEMKSEQSLVCSLGEWWWSFSSAGGKI